MIQIHPQEHEQILHQLHAEIVLERMGDYVDSDGNAPEKDESDRRDLDRRLLMEASSPSIDRKDIEKILGNGEFRDQLKQSIRHLIKPQSKEEP